GGEGVGEVAGGLGEHHFECVLGAEVRAAQVDCHHRVPVFGAQFYQRAEAGPAGAGDEDVEAAALGLGAREQAFDVSLFPHVGGDDEGGAAAGSDVVGDHLEGLLCARGEHDVDARLREGKGGAAADPRAGPGDDGDAAV